MTPFHALRADQIKPSTPEAGVCLQALHSFGLQTRAPSVVMLNQESDLLLFADAVDRGLQPILLGEGSNTVFVDEQLNRPVFKVNLKGRRYLGCSGAAHHFRLMAGENWHQWVEWSVASGFPGLENLALIPGSVGASPVQNIGAYGVEMCEFTEAIHILDLHTRQSRVLSRGDCAFAYRDSVFKGEWAGRCVITAVDFALPVVWTPRLDYGDVRALVESQGLLNPMAVMKAICAIRTQKLPDPTCLGNAGSFFKNPIVSQAEFQSLIQQHPKLPHYPAGEGQHKLAAAWLIEQSGLKGHRLGNVGVYDRQALILVNHGGGTGGELLSLIAHVVDTVQGRFGIRLEPEPNLITASH